MEETSKQTSVETSPQMESEIIQQTPAMTDQITLVIKQTIAEEPDSTSLSTTSKQPASEEGTSKQIPSETNKPTISETIKQTSSDTTQSVVAETSVQTTPGINFINALHARFSYESSFKATCN